MNTITPSKKILSNSAIPWITATKMTLAGLLAFLCIDHFKIPEGVWSLVTIAAITQAGLQNTLAKSAMRTLGTLLGALIGCGVVYIAQNDPFILCVFVFLFIGITSYIALQPTIYSYAGIISGMTTAIIVFFGIMHQSLIDIALNRTVSVLLGVAAISILNLIVFYVTKLFFAVPGYGRISWQLPHFHYQRNTVIAAFKVALACLITFFIWYRFNLPQGYWSTITCLLIMEENNKQTLRKGWLRLLSHVLAVVIAFGILMLLMHSTFIWRIVPLLMIFFFSGFLIGMRNQYASIGNTLAIAMAIMLFSSFGVDETLHNIIARFYNVLIGIVIAYAMLYPVEKYWARV